MSNQKYTPPKYGQEAFHCPHPGCGVYAKQGWFPPFTTLVEALMRTGQQVYGTFYESETEAIFRFNFCQSCNKFSVWVNENLLYPQRNTAPLPNEDMSEEVLQLYQEAANVMQFSPRASAALLRVALERLCKEYEGKGKNLSEKVQYFVDKGILSSDVSAMMDLIRKAGNEAAHPSEINFNENPQIAEWLFELIDCVAEEIITAPTKTKQAAENLKRILEAAEKTGKK